MEMLRLSSARTRGERERESSATTQTNVGEEVDEGGKKWTTWERSGRSGKRWTKHLFFGIDDEERWMKRKKKEKEREKRERKRRAVWRRGGRRPTTGDRVKLLGLLLSKMMPLVPKGLLEQRGGGSCAGPVPMKKVESGRRMVACGETEGLTGVADAGNGGAVEEDEEGRRGWMAAPEKGGREGTTGKREAACGFTEGRRRRQIVVGGFAAKSRRRRRRRRREGEVDGGRGSRLGYVGVGGDGAPRGAPWLAAVLTDGGGLPWASRWGSAMGFQRW